MRGGTCRGRRRGNDVPNLDVIRFLRLHDRRIAEIELGPRHTRDQRPGRCHSRRFRGGVRALAHFEIPERPSDVENARDPGPKVARKGVIQMGTNPFRFLFVGADAVEIEAVRPSVEVAGLEEVDVGVDVTRQDELSFRVDHRVAFLRNLGAVLDDRGDSVAPDDDGGVRNYLSRAGINGGAVGDNGDARWRGEGGGCAERS